MRETAAREAYLHRPVKLGAEAVSAARFEPDAQFLTPTGDFLKVMEHAYGFKVTRRTLQLYSSPHLRLLPRPLHIGGHISFYLHPEHTERLAAVLHLSGRLFMPLKAIRKLLKVFPERHYGLLLKGVLTPGDLEEFTDHIDRGLEVRDFLFFKVCRVLRALDEEHGDPRMQDESTRDKALFSMSRQFEKWLNSERRERAEAILSRGKAS